MLRKDVGMVVTDEATSSLAYEDLVLVRADRVAIRAVDVLAMRAGDDERIVVTEEAAAELKGKGSSVVRADDTAAAETLEGRTELTEAPSTLEVPAATVLVDGTAAVLTPETSCVLVTGVAVAVTVEVFAVVDADFPVWLFTTG